MNRFFRFFRNNSGWFLVGFIVITAFARGCRSTPTESVRQSAQNNQSKSPTPPCSPPPATGKVEVAKQTQLEFANQEFSRATSKGQTAEMDYHRAEGDAARMAQEKLNEARAARASVEDIHLRINGEDISTLTGATREELEADIRELQRKLANQLDGVKRCIRIAEEAQEDSTRRFAIQGRRFEENEVAKIQSKLNKKLAELKKLCQ